MSPRLRTLATGAALALLTAGSTLSWAQDDPANAVKYRQTVMEANSAHLGMIGAALKGEVGFTDQIAPNAEALAMLGQMLVANAQQMFPEGSDEAAGLKTVALPVIWQNWVGFEAAAQRFQQEATKLAEVAQGGDMAAIGQQVGALGKNGCGGCHTDFRKKSDS
jgi:cytochrome c556